MLPAKLIFLNLVLAICCSSMKSLFNDSDLSETDAHPVCTYEIVAPNLTFSVYKPCTPAAKWAKDARTVQYITSLNIFCPIHIISEVQGGLQSFRFFFLEIYLTLCAPSSILHIREINWLTLAVMTLYTFWATFRRPYLIVRARPIFLWNLVVFNVWHPLVHTSLHH
jgi:hypothetical protein